MTTVHDVAAITGRRAEYERNLLVGVQKGYRAALAGNSTNPYSTKQGKDFHAAWQFGHDHCRPKVNLDDVREGWLSTRKAHYERICGPTESAQRKAEYERIRKADTMTNAAIDFAAELAVIDDVPAQTMLERIEAANQPTTIPAWHGKREVVPFPITRQQGFIRNQLRSVRSYDTDGAYRWLSAVVRKHGLKLKALGVPAEHIAAEVAQLVEAFGIGGQAAHADLWTAARVCTRVVIAPETAQNG